MEPLTLRDLFLGKAGNVIRDKPNWWAKFKDDKIWKKWLEELRPLAPNQEITEAMEKYLSDELAYLAETRNLANGIDQALDMTYKSDILIPQSLKEELIACMRPLEDVPENLKDWHPHSNNQVLDLVHPSLYPVVFGKTRLYTNKSLVPCLPHVGGGETVADASVIRKRYKRCLWEANVLSSQFQWLPTYFSIDPATKEVKFEGYINNLHPVQHKKLYFVLEKLMSICLPMFDRVLFDMKHPPRQRAICVSPNWYIEGKEEKEGEEMKEDHGEEGVESEVNSEYEYWGKRNLDIPDAKVFKRPEIDFTSHESEDIGVKNADENAAARNKVTLSDFGRGQVIVKLGNIELTPENPEYPGGDWHLEGMLNERIIATVIYYYDSENITDNHLAFRQSVWTLEDYEQDDSRGFLEIFGLKRDEPAVQDLGYIATKGDRVISFPNLYQHKVSPFSLADRTKPGHRKICVFFLVDPVLPIISTSQVAPQQWDWWRAEIYKLDLFPTLPPEIVKNILDYVDWPMTLEEAKEVRLKFMQERGKYVKLQNEEYYAREFSLCEH